MASSVRGGPNAWQGLRGGSKEVSRIGAESFLIESTWGIPEIQEEIPEEDISRPISAMHRIRCRTVPRPTWEEEGIYTDDARRLLVARAIAQGESGARRIEWTSPAGSVETANGVDYSILWTILGSITPGYPHVITGEAAGAALALSESFKSIVELEINPARMRGYGKTNRAEMDFNGGNFSGAFWTLCRDPEQKRSLVDWLTEVLAPEIADLDFIHVQELGDVSVLWDPRLRGVNLQHHAERREDDEDGRGQACPGAPGARRDARRVEARRMGRDEWPIARPG